MFKKKRSELTMPEIVVLIVFGVLLLGFLIVIGKHLVLTLFR